MAKKHPDAQRIGGPGASHENRKLQRNHNRGAINRPTPKAGDTPTCLAAAANMTPTTRTIQRERPVIKEEQLCKVQRHTSSN
jgi:hypothetical protein